MIGRCPPEPLRALFLENKRSLPDICSSTCSSQSFHFSLANLQDFWAAPFYFQAQTVPVIQPRFGGLHVILIWFDPFPIGMREPEPASVRCGHFCEGLARCQIDEHRGGRKGSCRWAGENCGTENRLGRGHERKFAVLSARSGAGFVRNAGREDGLGAA